MACLTSHSDALQITLVIALLEEPDHLNFLQVDRDAVDLRAVEKLRNGLNSHICWDLNKAGLLAIGPGRSYADLLLCSKINVQKLLQRYITLLSSTRWIDMTFD